MNRTEKGPPPGGAVGGGAVSALFLASGAPFSFGVFFSALLEEFGWSRGALSGAFALYAFGYSCLSVASGHLTDRWGPRAVIAVGGAFLGAGWIAMSATDRKSVV